MPKKLTTEEFIKRAKSIHGDRYNYKDTVYVNILKKVKIGCTVHGEFEQTPADHLAGCGCRYCSNNNIKYTKEILIKKFKEIHGTDKYDYSLVDYINSKKKI